MYAGAASWLTTRYGRRRGVWRLLSRHLCKRQVALKTAATGAACKQQQFAAMGAGNRAAYRQSDTGAAPCCAVTRAITWAIAWAITRAITWAVARWCRLTFAALENLEDALSPSQGHRRTSIAHRENQALKMAIGSLRCAAPDQDLDRLAGRTVDQRVLDQVFKHLGQQHRIAAQQGQFGFESGTELSRWRARLSTVPTISSADSQSSRSDKPGASSRASGKVLSVKRLRCSVSCTVSRLASLGSQPAHQRGDHAVDQQHRSEQQQVLVCV